MKALTISQPFAHLIAKGEKRVENRTWDTSFRGVLAIHAGKGSRYMTKMERAEAEIEGMAFGAVVAVAKLAGCVSLMPALRVPDAAAKRWPWLASHRHTEGPVCWVLEDVVRLPQPVPCAGLLHLWELPPDVAHAVKAQLEAIAEMPLMQR